MNNGQPPVFHSMNQVLGFILAWLAQFLGLFSILFVAKAVGGASAWIGQTLGGYANKASEAVKGNPNNPHSLRNSVKHNVVQRGAATAGHRLNTMAGWTKGAPGPNAGRLSRAAWSTRRAASNAVLRTVPKYVGDLRKRQAEENEKFDKFISQKTSNGDDTLERAFFAKQWTDDDKAYTDAEGKQQVLRKGRYYSTYRGANGSYAESSAGDVKASHALYDRDEGKIQVLTKYELGKVANDADLYGVDKNGNTIYDPSKLGQIDRSRMPMGGFLGNLPSTLRDAGLNHSSAFGASTGAFYAKQGERRELKHIKLQEDGTWKQNTEEFVQDFAENVGSYPAASGKTSAIKRLTSLQQEYSKLPSSSITPAQQVAKADLQRIAASLDNSQRAAMAAAAQAQPGMVNPQNPAATQAGGVNSGGAGRTNEAIQEFIQSVRGGPTPPPIYNPNLAKPGDRLTRL